MAAIAPAAPVAPNFTDPALLAASHCLEVEPGGEAEGRGGAVGLTHDSPALTAATRQRSSVSTPTPISRATASGAALSGGSMRATARSLNACPYRANVFSHPRPRVVYGAGGRRLRRRHKAVDLWTMRFAHRPACRGQRYRVAHRAGLRPQAPQPPTTINEPEPKGSSPIGATSILTRGVTLKVSRAA